MALTKSRYSRKASRGQHDCTVNRTVDDLPGRAAETCCNRQSIGNLQSHHRSLVVERYPSFPQGMHKRCYDRISIGECRSAWPASEALIAILRHPASDLGKRGRRPERIQEMGQFRAGNGHPAEQHHRFQRRTDSRKVLSAQPRPIKGPGIERAQPAAGTWCIRFVIDRIWVEGKTQRRMVFQKRQRCRRIADIGTHPGWVGVSAAAREQVGFCIVEAIFKSQRLRLAAQRDPGHPLGQCCGSAKPWCGLHHLDARSGDCARQCSAQSCRSGSDDHDIGM